MAKKLLQTPDSINVLTVNGGGTTQEYTAKIPIQIQNYEISLLPSAVDALTAISAKLDTTAFSEVSGSFATTSQINDLTASTALITNNLNGVISNTAILKSDLDSLSSQYTQTNDNLIDLQNDFSDFSNDVNDYFTTNNENITEMSGKIENINSFNGVWTDNTLSGDGLNTPLSVTNSVTIIHDNNITGNGTSNTPLGLSQSGIILQENNDNKNEIYPNYIKLSGQNWNGNNNTAESESKPFGYYVTGQFGENDYTAKYESDTIRLGKLNDIQNYLQFTQNRIDWYSTSGTFVAFSPTHFSIDGTGTNPSYIDIIASNSPHFRISYDDRSTTMENSRIQISDNAADISAYYNYDCIGFVSASGTHAYLHTIDLGNYTYTGFTITSPTGNTLSSITIDYEILASLSAWAISAGWIPPS